MKNIASSFVLIFLVGTLLRVCAQPTSEIADLEELDPKIELDKIVIEEMTTINKLAGFSSKVWKSKTLNTKADHERGGVIVKFSELDEYAKRVGVKQMRQFLILVLAHEVTHLIQEARYEDYRSKEISADRKRLFECQADILAGKYLSETQGEPDQTFKEAIIDALKVAHAIAEGNGSGESTHPSPEQRRTAVQLGMASGLIDRLNKLPRTRENDSMIWTIADKIDRLPGEMPLDWSMKIARRVIHVDDIALKDIVVTKSDIRWDTDPRNPFVKFDYAFKNEGVRVVKLELEFQCVLVLRADSENTLEWKKWSVKNYQVRLKPGEQFIAKNQLLWGGDAASVLPAVDLKKFMPKFLAPIERKNALFSAQYDDPPEYLFEIAKLRNAISTLRKGANYKFKQYWIGGAVAEDDKKVYQSSIEIPAAYETRIFVPENDSSFVEAGIYSGTDPILAEKRYAETIAKLRLAFPDSLRAEKVEKSSGIVRRSVRTDELRDDKCWFELQIVKVVSNNRHRVFLTLHAPFDDVYEPPYKRIDDNVPEVESIEAKQRRLALEALRHMAAKNYEELKKLFRSDLATSANVDSFLNQWTSALMYHGNFKRNFEPMRIKHNGLDAISIICEMERNNMKLIVVFDSQSNIVSIWFMPST